MIDNIKHTMAQVRSALNRHVPETFDQVDLMGPDDDTADRLSYVDMVNVLTHLGGTTAESQASSIDDEVGKYCAANQYCTIWAALV